MGTDILYYIMDYSGNYYRTDQTDQLVAVTKEEDAAVFTLAQANNRIGTGKKAAFYCMVPIEAKKDVTDAETENLLDIFVTEEQVKIDEDEFVSPIKELTYDKMTERVEKNGYSYNLSEMDWAEYLTHFIYLMKGLKDYRDELAK